MQLCIAALPLHAACLELRRTSPDDKLRRTSRRPLLFLTRYVSALPDTNKTPTRRALVFSEAAFPSGVLLPTELPFLRTDRLETLAVYLLRSCLWLCSARTCLRSCFGFSGIARGGKHRLIKSTGGPPVNAALLSLLPSHYRDAVRSRLVIFHSRCICKRTGAIHLNSECAGGRLISRKGAGRDVRGCLWASADVKLEQPVP